MITGKTLYDSNGQQFYPYSDANYISSGIVVDTNMLKDDLIAIWTKAQQADSKASGEQTIKGQFQVTVKYICSTESTKTNIESITDEQWSDTMSLPTSSSPYCWKRTQYYWTVDSSTPTPFRTDYEICATALYPETQIMYTAILQIKEGLQGPADYGKDVEDESHSTDKNGEIIKWHNYFPGIDATKIYGYMATRHRDAGQNWPPDGGWHISLFAQYPVASSSTTK